jgi:hypothetical protein
VAAAWLAAGLVRKSAFTRSLSRRLAAGIPRRLGWLACMLAGLFTVLTRFSKCTSSLQASGLRWRLAGKGKATDAAWQAGWLAGRRAEEESDSRTLLL